MGIVRMATCEHQLHLESQVLFNNVFQVSGVPGVVGCIDGTYIAVRCPAKKLRSTYVNCHQYPSIALQAICDNKKRFLDVTIGHLSKVHDARVFWTSSFANRLPMICGTEYHMLGDAAYPLREYLLTPLRDYGNMPKQEKDFNKKFSATRVIIENAFPDLKQRFRQLLHLEFRGVDKITKFIISCCILHHLCIESGNNVHHLGGVPVDQPLNVDPASGTTLRHRQRHQHRQ